MLVTAIEPYSLEVWASAVCGRLEYHTTSASSVAHFSTMTYCIILPSPDLRAAAPAADPGRMVNE